MYLEGLSDSYMKRLKKRFWAKVDKRGPDDCWPWTGAQQPRGYGHFYIDGQYVSAHRASFELHTGPIGEGLDVCHLCDNPNCVNPNHLLAATRFFNLNDCITKGRWVKSREPAWATDAD